MQDKDRPITAQEAVEAYKKMQAYCRQFKEESGCIGCAFTPDEQALCFVYNQDNPDDSLCPDQWPDIKEAPNA